MNTSAPAYIVRPPDSQASSLLDLLPERDTESGSNGLNFETLPNLNYQKIISLPL